MASALWFFLAALILGEALLTWRSVLGFRAFFLRAAQQDPPGAGPWPKAAVLAPCKGADEGMRENILSWTQQDYPDFTIFFIVEEETDPAVSAVRDAVRPANILVAGRAADCGQKIHNLRHAVSVLPAEYELLAFVDSDARVRRDWLRSLAAQLMQHPEDAATGYRWFLAPRRSIGNLLRSAWNASVLTLYEPTGTRNFAWGGSMAILRRAFDAAGVLRFWQGSLSDDYALTNAMRASGRRVHFVPRAMAVTSDTISTGAFLSWAGRQLLITRFYFPHLWRMAFAFHALWMLWLVPGLMFHPLWLLASFLVVQTIQGFKSNLRLQCVRSVIPEAGDAAAFWVMSPFVGISNFAMLAWNVFTRTVRWRGVEYEVLGVNSLRRKREEPP